MIFLLLIGCSNDHKKLSNKESNIVKKCIEHLEENSLKELGDCYLVDPQFYYFSYSNYSDTVNNLIKEKIKKEDEENYTEIESKINGKYFKKFNEDLYNLSSCEESNIVVGFSGISNDMVMVRIVQNNKMITKRDLQNNYLLNFNEESFFIFILDKNGNIIDVINDLVMIG